MVYSGIPVTCEVFNLFAHLIPQEGLNRLERGRKRQAIVPDFKITLPDPIDGTRPRLAELKSITCCPTWYQNGGRVRAVDKRANLLQAEYRRKARNVDRGYGGVEEGVVGPVERRLAEYGDLHTLVMGAFGEASEDVHNLIQVMAESRVACSDLNTRHSSPMVREDMSVVVGQMRRRLSVATIRATYNCLLTRLTLLGEGVKEANARRMWRGREERIMSGEREAQWHRKIRGHGIRHRGEFLNS